VHYWLVNGRGGEKVLEALCEMYPEADLFTHVYVPERVSEAIKSHRVRTTFIQRLPKARTLYPYYLPLMPLALEQLDLRDYDLVISSESGPAKGVVARSDATHVCYCHSPMRYVWDLYHDYLSSHRAPVRWLMAPLLHYLRTWDAASAARVDAFVANSRNVERRVWRSYRRGSEVVHPPVDVEAFAIERKREDFYLVLGDLTAYKRVDLAIEAFNRIGRPLLVIGGGGHLARVRRMAGENVRVLGWQPDDVVREHYASCRALVFPGLEDFGIVPVEAMAAGTPVIAFRGGGALETVVDGKTGVFFESQTVDSLIETILRFEELEDDFDRDAIRAHARGFSKERFQKDMSGVVERALVNQSNRGTGLST
jgi:glycosyltransferase involved in cell wall biosynthesis